MAEYQRPTLTEEQQMEIAKAVRQLLFSPKLVQINIISTLMVENARLSIEVNAHRSTLGYDPLPLFNPIEKER